MNHYAILSAYSINELECKINYNIKNGHSPFGSLIAQHNGPSIIWIQPMISTDIHMIPIIKDLKDIPNDFKALYEVNEKENKFCNSKKI